MGPPAVLFFFAPTPRGRVSSASRFSLCSAGGDGNGQAKASGGSWKLPDWLGAVLAIGLVLLALKLWNEYQLRREEDLHRFGDV